MLTNQTDRSPPADVEVSAKETQGDKASDNEHYAAASVTTIFVNGEAVKIHDDVSHEYSLEVQNLVEIVVAYKLVALPTTKVHWRNFVVTAEEANVSEFLCKETDAIWGSSLDAPLSLGLSMVDHDGPRLGKTTERRSEGSGGSDDLDQLPQGVSNDMAVSRDKEIKGSMALDEAGGDVGTLLDPQASGTTLAPRPENISFPLGTPNNSSPKSHLEYLAWRHLEHILSVCAVPLSVPALFEEGKGQHTDDTTSVALTCGDMSGHLIRTSASL